MIKNSVLNKEVSTQKNHSASLIFNENLLNLLNDKTCIPLQEEIKSMVDPDDKKPLKALAKCITVSGTFTKRCEYGLITHSGLIAIDIDWKDNQQVLTDPDFFTKVCGLPFIAYFGKSISGSGYWGIIPISNPAKHKEHFRAIESVFKEIGIVLDKAPSNVASLRYQSYDENAYFNHSAERFTFIKESVIEPKKSYQIKADNSTDVNPFDDFNQNGDVEGLLLSAGWTYSNNSKADRKRFTRPGKSSGVSADWHTVKRLLYLFSSDAATGLETPMRGYNPVLIFYQLTACKSWAECAKNLKILGYGQPR